MMRALYSSVAGLKTHQTKMDVIGNNIANVNTVGFKSSRVTFSTMMYQSLSGASGANIETGKGGVNAKQIGLGTNFASTAVSIESGGAAESTGFAFDLKITDTNTTSFYIVNNGSENVFTRAGAFYVDGAGNLCMESTGYTVMGWQVDASGNIRKDTVSPLRIMSADNQTSAPEFTTKAKASGILDDNNANVNSDSGYMMNLNFFDNRGYSYTARFATQKTGEPNSGEYTINLTDILDSDGKSIMGGQSLSSLFGSTSGQGSSVDITDNYAVANGKSFVLKRLALGNGFDSSEPQKAVDYITGEPLKYTFTAETVNQYLNLGNNGLPENQGITVELQFDLNVDTGEVGSEDDAINSYTHSIKILNRNGDNVTTQYAEATTVIGQDENGNDITRHVYPWLVATTVENTDGGDGGDGGDGNVTAGDSDASPYKILTQVTLTSILEELESKGSLTTDTKGVELESKVLDEVLSAMGLDESKLQNLTVGELDQLSTLLSDLKNGNGKYTIRQATAADNIDSENTTNPTSATGYIIESVSLGADGTTPEVRIFTDNIFRPYTLEEYIPYSFITVDAAQANREGIFTTDLPSDVKVRYGVDGSCKIVTAVTDGFTLKFSTVDGSLEYIGQVGNLTQTLRMGDFTYDSGEDIPFSNIVIDFSTLKNLANGSSCTAAISKGDADADGTGKKVGAMIGLSVDQSGKIYGSYDNGNTVLLGQIAVARFANASGLESIGNNCFKTTLNSGDFDGIGVEIDSDGSAINSGELEMSNVDLATEFTQMITTQRGYQANSRVISTSDSILEELVNLKR